MATLEQKRAFPGKTGDACYQAGIRMVNKAGYQIVKRRDIASLLICNGMLQGCPVNLNLMVPFSGQTQVTLTLSGEDVDEAAMNAEAGRLFEMIEKEM